MKSQSIFFVHSSHKTKTWWMFLSVLILVFVPFLIVWLLNGEFNLLNSDWLVAKNASVWHGVVTSDNINSLVDRYVKFWQNQDPIDMLAKLRDVINGNPISINNNVQTFFDPVILAPILCLLGWSFLYPIIFNATKLSGLDVLPFSFGVGSFMTILILTGLMDHWSPSLMALYWIVRILIAFEIGL